MPGGRGPSTWRDNVPLRHLRRPFSLAKSQCSANGGRTVPAEPLQALPVVRVDPDAGVEREAIEDDAMALALEGAGDAEAPVHLGGPERGQGVRLHLV